MFELNEHWFHGFGADGTEVDVFGVKPFCFLNFGKVSGPHEVSQGYGNDDPVPPLAP